MIRPTRRAVLITVGLLLSLSVFFFDSELHQFQRIDSQTGELVDFGSRPALAASVALLMAFLWITETISIYRTACLPFILFPVLGVYGGDTANRLLGPILPYTDAYIFLFLGGMGIAAAMQQWNLHRRIALNILRAIGTRPQMILGGMILATAAVSMWISNTATTAMMLPIGMALIAQIESQSGGGRREFFGGALMLAIAYGANVGGMGTKIGTGPNAIFCGFASEHMGTEISFLDFLTLGLPFMVCFLPLVWCALWLAGRRDAPQGEIGRTVIEEQLRELGPISRPEKLIGVVFALTAILWILSGPITQLLKPLLGPLYDELFSIRYRNKHFESTTAILAVLALLCLPSGSGDGGRILRLGQLRVIPWPTLVLIGGGFSLAGGIDRSGLSQWMGGQMAFLIQYPEWIQFVGVCVFTVFFGAIASNVATITVMLLVLKSATDGSDSAGIALPLMAAATLASSCDFMLPAGTPPNAIVFGSGYVRISRMARIGFFLDLTAALLVAAWAYFGIGLILGI